MIFGVASHGLVAVDPAEEETELGGPCALCSHRKFLLASENFIFG